MFPWSVDIDECAARETNDCDTLNGNCLNNEGSYTCECKPGYTGDAWKKMYR